MSSSANIWFEEAYKLARLKSFEDIILPFGFFTAPNSPSDIQLQFPYKLPTKHLEKMVALSEYFALRLPSADEFIAEKRRVNADVINTLKTYFPLANTAISFGRIRGDIDVALCGDYSPNKTYEILKSNWKIAKEFPIVDWGSVCNFASEDGTQAASSLFDGAASMIRGGLSTSDVATLTKTLQEATLLYGKETHLCEFRNFVYSK